MLHEIKYLMMAVQFLTRLPVAWISGLDSNQPELSGKYFPQRGAKYLPVVGLFNLGHCSEQRHDGWPFDVVPSRMLKDLRNRVSVMTAQMHGVRGHGH